MIIWNLDQHLVILVTLDLDMPDLQQQLPYLNLKVRDIVMVMLDVSLLVSLEKAHSEEVLLVEAYML